ncbi:MAG: NAD(P)/FAD-dependent oxidoreductase [Oscillospiraceae bacterium]|nr:NAD(P)/FAD-dependent oxidoreductase [Oscillospiraceae bacterium]
MKNRIVNAPMAPPEMGPIGDMTPENIGFYGLRAKGGAAVVCVSEGIVHTRTGRSHTKHLSLDNPMMLPSLAEVAREIHYHNALASIELSHGGKYAGNRVQGQDPNTVTRFGPIDEVMADGRVVTAMPEELIYEIAEAFGKSAALCKQAGFDMVLIHAAHGWLLSQFMSPGTNKRTDKWGGSRENRMRFPLLVIEKIREAVGPGFPIEYRLSGSEYVEGGYDINECVEICKMLDGKVDVLYISAGVHENRDSFVLTHPSMFLPHGSNVHLAAAVKKHMKRTPVGCVGGINDPAQAEEILASGQADLVCMARQLLVDPDFPKKALSGHAEDITKCCRCFTCFASTLSNRITSCALNPTIGRELDQRYGRPATSPKRLVIVGGGPGGMQAALTAREQGHEVILLEKASRLGGQLNCEEFVPFKADLYAYARQQERRVLASGTDVRLNTEATPELIEALHPDALVLAVGAKPVTPPIPGIDSPNVKGLEALHQAVPDLGQKVVILGGGLVGSETAVYLNSLGKDVTVVEMKNDFAAEANEMHKIALEHEFAASRIQLHLNTTAVRVTEEGLICRKGEEEFTLKADSILLAAGMRADWDTVEQLRYAAPWYWSIGDCVKAGQVVAATEQGHNVVLDL